MHKLFLLLSRKCENLTRSQVNSFFCRIRAISKKKVLAQKVIYFRSEFVIFCYLFYFFYYRSICIIDSGASRRRTRNARFQARRADHSTTSMCHLETEKVFAQRQIYFTANSSNLEKRSPLEIRCHFLRHQLYVPKGRCSIPYAICLNPKTD